MQRMKWWILGWLVAFVSYDIFSQHLVSGNGICVTHCNINGTETEDTIDCLYCAYHIVKTANQTETVPAIKKIAEMLEKTKVSRTSSVTFGDFLALLHKPNGTFSGFEVYASENQVEFSPFQNNTVSVQLPRELDAGPENEIVFSMFKLPNFKTIIPADSHELYGQTLVGLDVQGKSISGLKKNVNITIKLIKDVNETHELSCQFLNFSTNKFSKTGCLTLWKPGQSEIICSCDHLTYFGVLVAPREWELKTVIDFILNKERTPKTIDAMKNLEERLEEIEVNGTKTIHFENFVALLYEPTDTFKGLQIYASDSQAAVTAFPSSIVTAQLPRELNAGLKNKIVFAMLKWPENRTNISGSGSKYEIYDQRLIILSVQGKNISGLNERVNITVNLTKEVNETQELSCQFLNFSTDKFSQDGCLTLWTHGQDKITCSCDHLTYFAVLMSLPPEVNLSPENLKILTYITLIGCSVSLFALVITLFLFITNRTLREDVSMKVHINLVIALILLNTHFLPNKEVSALSNKWFCFCFALGLHYSLLATFSWMAIEGFNIYLLLVKVFNIHISKYLLKLSVVGWGMPAVIVAVMVIIDRDFYGHVPLDKSNADDTKICFITVDKVKVVTTVGLFTIVFLFNISMFMITVKRVFSARHSKESEKINCDRTIQIIGPVMGVSALLGITWGLAFFTFDSLTTPVLYLFCITNSLQGLFIFLWFVMSLRKKKSAPKPGTETRSTSN